MPPVGSRLTIPQKPLWVNQTRGLCRTSRMPLARARWCAVAPRRPPVCAACSRGPHWATATNVDPSPAPSRGRAPCHGSACVRSPARRRSAPCLQTRGGGGGGGGACGLWTGPGPCPGPGLCMGGHLIGADGVRSVARN